MLSCLVSIMVCRLRGPALSAGPCTQSRPIFSHFRSSEIEGGHTQVLQPISPERGQEEDILSFAVCFERKHRRHRSFCLKISFWRRAADLSFPLFLTI